MELVQKNKKSTHQRRKFTCPKCERCIFDLNRHLKAVHNEKYSYRVIYPAIIKSRKRKSKVIKILNDVTYFVLGYIHYIHLSHIMSM